MQRKLKVWYLIEADNQLKEIPATTIGDREEWVWDWVHHMVAQNPELIWYMTVDSTDIWENEPAPKVERCGHCGRNLTFLPMTYGRIGVNGTDKKFCSMYCNNEDNLGAK